MGSGWSLYFATEAPGTNLGDLPESCVACVLENMQPQQICQLAVLNRAFRGASSADFVWESKLPVNYNEIFKRLFGDFDGEVCKKDLYSVLCHPNSFDADHKKAWLDKSSGKMCLAISSNGLSITGIDDRRHWNRIPTEESRFSSIAYLQQTWWFEVNGEVEFPLPAGTYSVFFRLQLGKSTRRFGRRVCNSQNVHGWDIKPVQFQLSTSGKQQATSCYLRKSGNWNYYHGGDFVVENSNKATKIKFSMMQIDCTHTKGGLCVDSVVVYPVEFKERLAHF
ncbi:F-box protein PP2-A12-like [Apium graveolens]|uniref:F-box protein PP2-A12-like n=1 Tax=Apium graveolens TaxID=4045 RepID=UPI003D794C20